MGQMVGKKITFSVTHEVMVKVRPSDDLTPIQRELMAVAKNAFTNQANLVAASRQQTTLVRLLKRAEGASTNPHEPRCAAFVREPVEGGGFSEGLDPARCDCWLLEWAEIRAQIEQPLIEAPPEPKIVTPEEAAAGQ